MVDITTDPPPPFNLCPGETILLISNVTGGTPPYTYLWADGSTGPTTIITPPYNGSFPLDVTDAIGCVASNSIHIKASVWTVDILYNLFSLCVGDSMALFAYPGFPSGTTFLWSTGETSESIFITTSGTYSLTATAPGGACSDSHSEYIEMSFFPQPDPSISGPTVLCPGQNATLTAQGEPGDMYNWSTGEVTSSIIISDPGTYWVTVTNDFGCTGIDSIEILEGSTEPEISAPLVLCPGQNGTIEITNASSYIDFLWNTGETTSTIIINAPGIYSVTVTASGGCTSTGSVTVNGGNSNITIDGNVSHVTSCLSPNGSVDISVSPAGTYMYIWSNGATTEDINNLSSGMYSVTVTDSGGCSSSATYVVDSNIVLPTTTSDITASSCDLSNGAIDLSVTPPGTYTYIWSNGSTSEDLFNIPAGTYSVTVTSSSSGCSATASATVPNINLTLTITGNTTPLTSCTSPNGAVDISTTPFGAYTYLWSNGATTEDIANLTSGSYTVTVSAGGSCTSTAAFSVDNNTNPPIPSITSTSATCGESNGALDLSVLPAGSYSYLWSNGATTEDLAALPAGIYSVTVTDVLTSCTSTAEVLLPDDQITIDITGSPSPNTSCLSFNGAVDITINPSGTYSFLWSNGQTTEDITALPAGSYTVTATLGLTCNQTAVFEVSENIDPILISGSITPNSSCTQPNGAIDVSVDPPGVYLFVWTNGEMTEDISQLTGGTYAITVTDNEGCTAVATFEVINTSSNYTFEALVTPNTACSAPDGSIDLMLSPPGSYSFLWSNGSATEDIDQLAAGSYAVTVTDINNCSAVATYTVTDSLLLPSITAQISPETCGNINGAIDVTVTPANGNVFSWSTGSTNEDISNLAAGMYSLTVTASNGCTVTESFSVLNQNSTFVTSGTVIPNKSCNTPNGSIDLTVSPPGAYTFAWSNSDTSEDLSGLTPGSYTVTVADIANCTSIDTFLVGDITNPPLLDANITPSICGTNNGAIDLIVNQAVNIVFLWSNGTTDEDLQNLLSGTYSVIAIDTLSGCITLDTFSVPNINNNFSSSAVITPNTACVSPNGAIDLVLLPAGTYTYFWSNGATVEDLTNLVSGSYIVTITDITSCALIDTFVITDNLPDIMVSATISPSSCGMGDGAIDLTINPSVGNTFSWSNGGTNEDLLNLFAGEYIVTVTGSGGCTKVDTFIVNDQGLAITLQGITVANTNCSSANGSVDLSVIPNGAYTYLWSTGNTSQDLGNLSPGMYTVTVSDINGCSSAASYTIDDQTISPVIQATITPSNCGNTNGQIDLTILPAGSYVYTWSNGATSEDLTALLPGMYAVTVTGQGSCTADTILEVQNAGLTFTLSATITANTSCTGSNGSIGLTISPAGAYTYIWSNGEVTEDLQNIPSGTYTVSVSDQSGCSTESQYTVDNNVSPLLVKDVITPALCGEPNGAIDLTVTPETGNTFEWSNGSVAEDLTDLPGGQYAVTVTSQNGCSWSSTFDLPESEAIQITLEADVFPPGSTTITITAQLNVPVSALDTLIWMPEELFSCDQEICLKQTITRPAGKTEISVIAIDTSGCKAIEYLILDEFSNPAVYIPNVFSPNGDGVNDFFTIYGNKDVKTIVELQIFDRWGNQVFVKNEFPPNEENYGWDGLFRDKAMNPAVYAFWARVRYVDSTEEFFKGDVTLVR